MVDPGLMNTVYLRAECWWTAGLSWNPFSSSFTDNVDSVVDFVLMYDCKGMTQNQGRSKGTLNNRFLAQTQGWWLPLGNPAPATSLVLDFLDPPLIIVTVKQCWSVLPRRLTFFWIQCPCHVLRPQKGH